MNIVSDEVRDFLARFDSLFGKCPPHATLVFPFVSDVSDRELTKALQTAATSRGAFDITLLAPQFESGYVILPLDQQEPWLRQTHQELSRLVGARPIDEY